MLPENIPVHDLREGDFFIVEAIEHCEPENFRGIHRHNFHEILLFTEAAADEVQSIDFTEYRLRPGQLYFLRRGQVHRMKLRSQKGYLFAFSPGYFDRIDLRIGSSIGYGFPAVVTLRDEDVEPIRQIASLIFGEFEGQRRKELLDAYLNAFFILLMSGYAGRTPEAETDSRVKRFLASVEEHFMHCRATSFYAGQVLLSDKRLNELVRQSLGKTVTQVIHERLLLEAKRLICFEELSFKEIAFRLGFSDASYFTRFFRSQSGMTPEQFRQSL